jgi:glycosyltransferase involved in cell wall biosynthesis
VHVVPIGFDLDQFAAYDRARSTFRADHHIPADAPLIGIVGRLVPIKNHALFIQAAARVHAARPEVRFVLIGDGERRSTIEALVAELGLADIVTFAGWVVDTPPVYAALDVLALSSRNEGVPVSVIEAMAAGVPVVSTQVGGVPDLIARPEFGFTVAPDDPAAFADGMLAALDRGATAHPLDLDGARRHVLATYGVAPVARAHQALYADLLHKRGFSEPARSTPAPTTPGP